MKLLVKKLDESAILPTKSYDAAAGIDLYSIEDVKIMPGQTVKIHTGIAVKLEDTLEKFQDLTLVNLLWDRSGLGSKGQHRLAGVIDVDYRGEILVCLTNLNIFPVLENLGKILVHNTASTLKQYQDLLNQYSFTINKGDKIVQMLVQTVIPCDIVEVKELDQTKRGKKGFGSSDEQKRKTD